ncbi:MULTISPECIES: hypothetical protein [Amycolatopsis]|uniref:hypothetical protein n=1 Tax=Amycolatopsis TaxID=1813 RepID=UPI00039D0D7B|nr:MULTISPECIES: hypothetical protein [Amycolatopsis]
MHRFIARFPGIPLAGWCDLDPDGIGIIGRAERATRRTITSIGMDLDLWRRVTADSASSLEEIEQCRQVARNIEALTPPALGDLLASFQHTGLCAEQQYLVVDDEVLPALPSILAGLENEDGAIRLIT